ncbi:MAG: hypothetical protein PHS04_05520 [Tissierellia bacterium]|nr:hypothetical protein [Tissierellia bacterium]
MAIIQQPDALSMSGNMKKFIVSSGTQISFELKEGDTVLLSATYEPGMDGRATIDIKDIIGSRLNYIIKYDNIYEQTELVKSFTATIDGVTSAFKVIRSGVANLQDTPANWLKNNFLTWQPQNKYVTYNSPEWLTYYAQESCNIMLKAYLPGNTVQNVNLGACEPGKAFTFNLRYAFIAGKLNQQYPTYFDVWAETTAGIRLTYIQRYLYSDPKSEQEQWFMFENSLGGLDTVRASGNSDFTGRHDHKLSAIDNFSAEYDVDTERTYNKNTGYLDNYERRWLLDFFPSKKKYIYHLSAIRAIVVTDSDVKYTSSDLPSEYNFTYKFSDADTSVLLNLIRNEDIPVDITIPNLDSPDFHLPPRLSEYPLAYLHEGVIFPVFDPNTEQAQITTFGRLVERVIQDVSVAVKDRRLSMRFEFTNGNAFANIPWETTVTVHVFRGFDEITGSIPFENWNWTRKTTDPIDDNAWNISHNRVTDTLTLKINDQQNDFGNNIYIDRQCVFTVTVLVPDTGETISKEINYASY